MRVKCADCGCLPSECELSKSPESCPNCSWKKCCCRAGEKTAYDEDHEEQ